MDFLKELRTKNIERCEASFYKLHDWSLTDWATALAGETGELCNLIKKIRRGDQVESEAVADEIADVAIYLDLLAARLDLDLKVCIIKKFNKVSDKLSSPIRLS